MIVHDLKNPLNVILNALDSQSIKSHINMLRRSSKQMLNMVLNILDVQKFEDAKMELETCNCSLLEVSVKAVNQVNLLSKQKSITIQTVLVLESGENSVPGFILKPFITSLQNLMVYESTDVYKILNQIKCGKSQNLLIWNEEMKNVLYSMNEERYAELLKLIAPKEK